MINELLFENRIDKPINILSFFFHLNNFKTVISSFTVRTVQGVFFFHHFTCVIAGRKSLRCHGRTRSEVQLGIQGVTTNKKQSIFTHYTTLQMPPHELLNVPSSNIQIIIPWVSATQFLGIEGVEGCTEPPFIIIEPAQSKFTRPCSPWASSFKRKRQISCVSTEYI